MSEIISLANTEESEYLSTRVYLKVKNEKLELLRWEFPKNSLQNWI